MVFALSERPNLHRAYLVTGPYSFSETVWGRKLLYLCICAYQQVQKLQTFRDHNNFYLLSIQIWQGRKIEMFCTDLPIFVPKKFTQKSLQEWYKYVLVTYVQLANYKSCTKTFNCLVAYCAGELQSKSCITLLYT